MTWLPRSPSSTLVFRINQETVHDFILLFMPPCGPHLTPLATWSLERNLLLFSTPGGLIGDDLSRLFFTCTNTSQAATCTCNTYPRISPHNVVNHSSHKEATIHWFSNHTWSSMCAGIKFHTCIDSVNTKNSAKSVKEVLKLYYMTDNLYSNTPSS
jgi:hypothetical protein